MRALVIDNGLRFEKNYPTPTPPQGEALVRVLQAGVCNTDLELVKGYMNFTGVPGHEFVGVVEQAVGREELIGQRVAGEINAACGVCETCRANRPTHCPNRTTLGIDRRDWRVCRLRDAALRESASPARFRLRRSSGLRRATGGGVRDSGAGEDSTDRSRGRDRRWQVGLVVRAGRGADRLSLDRRGTSRGEVADLAAARHRHHD